MAFLSKLRVIIFLIVLLVGGPVMLVVGYKEAKDSRALADHGVTVEATVIDVTNSTKRGRERNFHAKISYTTADGSIVRDDVSVGTEQGKALRDALASEPKLSVRYLPEDPTTVALADHKDESNFFYGIGALMLLVGIGMLVYRLRKKPDAE
ncbi:uncharacterized protein DUF3592 [Tahibacter aquaticus]|uniref:Uncharacterized protein DUF3592 n=1 Tax=Tahibacter aquaticus TaxID=520092 RepID=A0A4R6YSX9_9GAMM|nr:DUF3592 domain-containing protein [Tahibacter aquaticus]TDR41266.1 uncharacterized protein DUF3592 [Tahibacter aquaticus]